MACLCLLAACSAPESRGPSAVLEPVRGQILSESGEPIENATVEAIVLGSGVRKVTRSDASGAFDFADLSADEVESLRVEHPDFGAWPPPCLHPGPAHSPSAAPIRLRARRPERILALDLLTGAPIDRIFVERFPAACEDSSATTARTPLPPRAELDTRTQSLAAVLEFEVYRFSAEGYASTQVKFAGDALNDDRPTTVRLSPAAEIVGQVVVPTGITGHWSIVLEAYWDGDPSTFWDFAGDEERHEGSLPSNWSDRTSITMPLGREGGIELRGLARWNYQMSIRNDLGIVVKWFEHLDLTELWHRDLGQIEVEDLRNARFSLRNVDASGSSVESLFLRSPRHHFGASIDDRGEAVLSQIPAGDYRVQVLLASGERLELRTPVCISASNDGVFSVDLSDVRKR